MRALRAILLAAQASLCISASSWGFQDGSISLSSKGAEKKGGSKEEIAEGRTLKKPIVLGAQDTIKILLTTKEGSKTRRPHQTFLNLQDNKSDLETSFPLQVKESGKGKLELSQKDIPAQLLSSIEPLKASLFIASFGSSKGYNAPAFDLKIEVDSNSPLLKQEQPVRYGKLPEIHHTFKSDPQSPSKIITLVFTLAVIAALPALLIVWTSLGANLDHVSTAFSSSPIPHTLFFFSILGLEGVFFLYYTHWKLFQVLPTALGIGLITFLSGSRALREVQQRRLGGSR